MSIEQQNNSEISLANFSEERISNEKEIVVPLEHDLSSTAIEDTEKNIVENTSSENSKDEQQCCSELAHEAKQESKSIQKLVEKKHINSLSEDERALIIANAKAGIDQPYFDVKFLKNGNVHITKKKAEQKSVASKVVSAKPPTKNVQQCV